MKKGFIITIFVFAAALLAGVFFFWRGEPLKMPNQEEIIKIQLDTVKIEPAAFGEEKLAALLKEMEAVRPLNLFEKLGVPRSESYYVLSFLYQDGGKELFYFFLKDNLWYLQTEDKRVYKGADFIEEYTQAYETVTRDWETESIFMEVPDRELLEYGVETGFDLRYQTACLVSDGMENGLSREEAFASAYHELASVWILYQYAVEEGFEVSEEDYARYLDRRLSEVKEQENYEEMQQVFKEAGTALGQMQEEAAYGRIFYTVECLRQAKREEFRNGMDTVDSKAYDSANEYWNAFAWKVLEQGGESLDFTSFDQAFEEAATACDDFLDNRKN